MATFSQINQSRQPAAVHVDAGGLRGRGGGFQPDLDAETIPSPPRDSDGVWGSGSPSDAARGIGQCSVQIPIFKLSRCSWQKVSLLGGFSAERGKRGSVVISSGALPRTPGLADVTELAEHHCGGCCAGQSGAQPASEGCCLRHHGRGGEGWRRPADGTGLHPVSPGGELGDPSSSCLCAAHAEVPTRRHRWQLKTEAVPR